MGSILSFFLMLIYFGSVITIAIYMIRLFTRFVDAIERIANSVEDCCKSKTSQPG